MLARRAAGVREEALERIHPRVDDHLVGAVEGDPGLGEPEAVADDELGAAEPVAAPQRRGDLVAAAKDAPGADDLGRDRPLSDAVDDHRPAGQRPAVGAHLQADRKRLAFDELQMARAAAKPHRPVEQAHPSPRHRRREGQPDGDREHRVGPEPPGGDVQAEGQPDHPSAALRHTGTRVRSTASRMESAASTPAVRASGARMTRWVRTSVATSFTSAGTT